MQCVAKDAVCMAFGNAWRARSINEIMDEGGAHGMAQPVKYRTDQSRVTGQIAHESVVDPNGSIQLRVVVNKPPLKLYLTTTERLKVKVRSLSDKSHG